MVSQSHSHSPGWGFYHGSIWRREIRCTTRQMSRRKSECKRQVIVTKVVMNLLWEKKEEESGQRVGTWQRFVFVVVCWTFQFWFFLTDQINLRPFCSYPLPITTLPRNQNNSNPDPCCACYPDSPRLSYLKSTGTIGAVMDVLSFSLV